MSECDKPSPQLLVNPVHLLSTGFGSGLAPKAPGTAGTLVGVLVYLPLQYLDWRIYLAVNTVLFLLGIWLCGRTSAVLGGHDHGAIVWDEIIGYLVTMTLAPQGWQWLLLGFLLFRLFDIGKPWPISWLDRRIRGGLGIMLDDLVAGIFGAFCLQIIAYILLS